MFLKKSLYIVSGILLSIILLFTSVEIVSFNLEHYNKSFIKYNITEETGMDMENLQHTIEDILQYFKDDRAVLDTRAVIKGEEREVFGEREIQHMVDVKGLFVKGRIMRNVSILILILIVILLIKTDKRWKKGLYKTMIYTSLVNIALLIILLILMQLDFHKYFTYFHLMFFTNDLWLLNPKTDLLIQIVPQEFFFSTAVKIVSYFAGTLVIIGLLGFYLLKDMKKKNKWTY